jgi:hypothetical protein
MIYIITAILIVNTLALGYLIYRVHKVSKDLKAYRKEHLNHMTKVIAVLNAVIEKSKPKPISMN